uniref:Uncharacterized protein n=1 Tax=Strombidinopsis acuminata TaxID=141414 RepID=A0A7S3SX36_9SPIT
MARGVPMARGALRAVAGVCASAAAFLLMPSALLGGVSFADPSWIAARGAATMGPGLRGLSPKPLPMERPADAESEVAVTVQPVRRGLRFGLSSIGAALMLALPRRQGRDGKGRRPLLASGMLSALPAGTQAFVNSQVGVMLRLTALNFCKIYMAMLVLRITIMWFPNINPYRQPFYSMIQLTDPYLNLFRGWMPPIFGIDLSVILAFVVIQAVIDTLTLSPF